MSDALISVMMPVHNGQATLEAAIDSLLAQDTPDWELWIIDDASTDDTSRIVATYAQRDHRIHTLTLSHQMGVSHARQQALVHAQGIYIAHLDADDIAHPQRLSLQRRFMQTHPQAVLCATDVERFTHEHPQFHPLSDHSLYEHHANTAALRYRLCLGNPLVSSSVMYPRQLALDNGGFDPTLTVAEDYALFCELLKYGSGCFLPVRLTAYRSHLDSLSTHQADHMRETALHIGYRFSSYWLSEPTLSEIPAWYRWIHSHGNANDVSLGDAFVACCHWLRLTKACPDTPVLNATGQLSISMAKTLLGKIIGHHRAVALFQRLHQRLMSLRPHNSV